MKMNVENTRIVLKDYNISHFFAGIIFTLIGLGVIYFMFSQNLLVAVFGAIFSIVGIWLLASTKLVNVVLDKGNGKGTFSFRSILKNEKREIGLEEVEGIRLQKTILQNKKNTSYQYIIAFVLKNGDDIPLEFGNVGAGVMDVLSSPDGKKKEEAGQIAQFLGVGMKFVGPPSVQDALSAIKDGIAGGIEKAGKNKPV